MYLNTYWLPALQLVQIAQTYYTDSAVWNRNLTKHRIL